MIDRSTLIVLRIVKSILLIAALFLIIPGQSGIASALLILFAALIPAVPKCPHCAQRGLHPKLWEENAGYCRHCGKLVEYKEYHS